MASSTKQVHIGKIPIGGGAPLAFIAGHCVIENRDSALEVATELKKITAAAGVPFIFKASFDKANRSSGKSYRGPGLKEGVKILAEIREKLGVPVLTDVHEVEQVGPVAEALDVLQIPAFLCRQTDLLIAAAKSGKPVNIKKGQFVSPWDMKSIVAKIAPTITEKVTVCERGASFGYNNLVVDMRSLCILREQGYPVVYDATHSLQLPGGGAGGETTAGYAQYIPPLARAAAAIGVDAFFMEVHKDPSKALSDGQNTLKLTDVPALLESLKKADAVSRGA